MPSGVPVERLFRSSTTLHRSTQELSIQAAELDAALSRDGSARFQQTVSAQQRVRIGGMIALAVATTLMRGGNLMVIAIAAVISGFYLTTILRASTVAHQANRSSRGVGLFLASADAIAATLLCAVAAAGGNTDTLMWILIIGGIAPPA